MTQTGYIVSPAAKKNLWFALGWLAASVTWAVMAIVGVPVAQNNVGWGFAAVFGVVVVAMLVLAATRTLRLDDVGFGPVLGGRITWNQVTGVRIRLVNGRKGAVDLTIAGRPTTPTSQPDIVGPYSWADKVATTLAEHAGVEKKVVTNAQRMGPARRPRR